MEIVGNGVNALNRPSEGLVFFNSAIAIAEHDKDVGTPFMALKGKRKPCSYSIAKMKHKL